MIRDWRSTLLFGLVAWTAAFPSRVQAALTWAEANQFGGRVVEGFNDEPFIRTGGCLDCSQLPQPGLGFRMFILHSFITQEYGALFPVAASGTGQKFDVWVLARDGTGSGAPIPAGNLQVRMREFSALNSGSNPAGQNLTGTNHGAKGRFRLNRAVRLGTIAAWDLTNGRSRATALLHCRRR